MAPEGKAYFVYPFVRSEPEVRELAAVAKLWREGEERFWAFDDVLAALSRPASLGFYAAAEQGGTWAGVILCDVGPYTADLLYIYVRREARQAGVGRALLARLMSELAARPQIEALFLEVRASNGQAQRLYEAAGMRRVGQRRGYYADGEDALVYKLEYVR